MTKNYLLPDPAHWSGRQDSTTDYDSFRWHQWIECLDLSRAQAPFEGRLGIAILGFRSDKGIAKNLGRTGAGAGPAAIRQELANLPCAFDQQVKLFDAGDITSEPTALAEAQDALAEAITKLLSLGLFPVVLGGGHDIAYGHFKGVFDHFQGLEPDAKLGIINFDAHFDNRPYHDGPSSGTMFRQIEDLLAGAGRANQYFVLGIQESANTASLFKHAQAAGTEYILAKDIAHGDIFSLFERLDQFLYGLDGVYVTIDADVFSSSIAPGVSSPQPLGLQPEIVIALLKYILASNMVVSLDVAEVSPRFDHDSSTATLAASLIFSAITKLAGLSR